MTDPELIAMAALLNARTAEMEVENHLRLRNDITPIYCPDEAVMTAIREELVARQVLKE